MAENEKREIPVEETPNNVEAEPKATVKVEEQEIKKPEKKKAAPPNGTAKVW